MTTVPIQLNDNQWGVVKQLLDRGLWGGTEHEVLVRLIDRGLISSINELNQMNAYKQQLGLSGN